MEKQEYLIGDVAAITGLSRDTLRFYEKKGILSARKKDNGYRYFTEEDLYLLVHVLFSRRLNLDLNTTRQFLPSTPMRPDYQEIISRQIEEERKAIRFHRQALGRLRSMKEIYDSMEKCRDRFCVKPFPSSYVLRTIDSPLEGMKQWFSLSHEYAELDMVYIYDCYQYQSGFSLRQETDEKEGDLAGYEAELTYGHSFLALYQDVTKILESDYDFSRCETFSDVPCLHTVVEESDTRPKAALISAMKKWAADQGILASSQVYVTSNLSGIQRNSSAYCQEIYIPLLSS